HVDLRQPLHIRHAVPTRHDETQRRALMSGQRIAVETVGEERLRRQRLLAIEAPAERNVHLELLGAEFDLFFAVIGAEEHELARRRGDPRSLEHRFQRDAHPSSVAAETLERTAVAGTFEPGDELACSQLFYLVE